MGRDCTTLTPEIRTGRRPQTSSAGMQYTGVAASPMPPTNRRDTGLSHSSSTSGHAGTKLPRMPSNHLVNTAPRRTSAGSRGSAVTPVSRNLDFTPHPAVPAPSQPRASTPNASTAPQVLKRGWLEKHGSGIFNKKKKLYFVLSDGSIAYYDDPGKMRTPKNVLSLRGATCRTEKGCIELEIVDGSKGNKKKYTFSLAKEDARSGASLESWSREISDSIRACVRRSTKVFADTYRRNHDAFDVLFQTYRSHATNVVGGTDAADVDSLLKCAQDLTDPSQLALSKLKESPHNSQFLQESLESIWHEFDVDGDGILNETENARLIEEYFRAELRNFPELIRDVIHNVMGIFLKPDVKEDFIKKHTNLLNTKLDGFESTLRTQLKTIEESFNLEHLSRDVLSKMDVNQDGKVEKSEFVTTFLEATTDISSAISSCVGDEIARLMQQLFAQQLKNPIGKCGLKNLGNTCYMNAAIQCLSATIRFRQFFISGNYTQYVNKENKLGTQGRLCKAFADMLEEMWKGNAVFAPKDFKKELGKANDTFSGWGQEDSQEFISTLLDKLHEDLNRVSVKQYVELDDPPHATDEELAALWWEHHIKQNRSILVTLFQGQIRSTVVCATCDYVSKNFDPFMYLSLPIPAAPANKSRVDLVSALDTYMGLERVKSADEWYCKKCKTHRPFSKEVSLWKLPNYLIVHLKRFKYSVYGTITSKITTEVDFPLQFSPEAWLARPLEDALCRDQLDESLAEATPCIPYLASPASPGPGGGLDGSGMSGARLGGSTTSFPPSPATSPRRVPGAPPFSPRAVPQIASLGQYHLYAIVNHYGTSGGGHYTAFADVGGKYGGWHVFDDSYCKPLKEDPRAAARESGYLLFYELR